MNLQYFKDRLQTTERKFKDIDAQKQELTQEQYRLQGEHRLIQEIINTETSNTIEDKEQTGGEEEINS